MRDLLSMAPKQLELESDLYDEKKSKSSVFVQSRLQEKLVGRSHGVLMLYSIFFEK